MHRAFVKSCCGTILAWNEEKLSTIIKEEFTEDNCIDGIDDIDYDEAVE